MTREQALVCVDRLFGGYVGLVVTEANRGVYADAFERVGTLERGLRVVDLLHVEHKTPPAVGRVFGFIQAFREG